MGLWNFAKNGAKAGFMRSLRMSDNKVVSNTAIQHEVQKNENKNDSVSENNHESDSIAEQKKKKSGCCLIIVVAVIVFFVALFFEPWFIDNGLM